MFSHLRWFVDCARFGLNTNMTLWWVFWRLRWNSRPLGGSLVSAGYLLAHWYLQQYKCTTGYLQLNGALSIKLHMCHHHHFGRFHKQTNGLWVRFCQHGANIVLESNEERRFWVQFWVRFCHHSANPVLESNEERLQVRFWVQFWVRFCHHSANPVLESYGEGLEVESTLSESTYSHTKYISLFWISTLKWRKEIIFPCPAGALRGCSALRLSC